MAEANPNIDFTDLVTVPNATPELALAEKKAAFDRDFSLALKQQFSVRVEGFRQLYNAVWKNPMGLTPKQAIQALGTKAARVFAMSSMEAQYLNTYAPGIVPEGIPNNYASVSFNADGSLKDLVEAN